LLKGDNARQRIDLAVQGFDQPGQQAVTLSQACQVCTYVLVQPPELGFQGFQWRVIERIVAGMGVVQAAYLKPDTVVYPEELPALPLAVSARWRFILAWHPVSGRVFIDYRTV